MSPVADDLRAGIEALRRYPDPIGFDGMGDLWEKRRGAREGFVAGAEWASTALLAAHPVQDEVTFETTLLDPVWLTTSSSRYTTRPVSAPVQVTTAEELDDLAADIDLIDPMHTIYEATDSEPAECMDECPGCAADRIRAALGIVVSDRPEVTP